MMPEVMPSDGYWNLVVRASPEYPMIESRMLEGTVDEVKYKLFPFGGYDLNVLSHFPVVMTKEFAEDDKTTEAVVGYMDRPSLDPKISHPVMTIPSHVLMNLGLLGKWENTRTRWAVKRGNPFRLLAEYAIAPAAQRQVTDVVCNQAAVMMPFDKGHATDDPVYRAIGDGARGAGFTCKRVDEIVTPTVITDDIRDLIQTSGVVVADISGLNPNVMYELGYAQGCGKQVVIISSDDMSKLPFDIRQRRVISYSREDYGLANLSGKVRDVLGMCVVRS